LVSVSPSWYTRLDPSQRLSSYHWSWVDKQKRCGCAGVRDDADWCAERNSVISDDAGSERRKQSQTCRQHGNKKHACRPARRQPRQRSRA
jgi:hypothetical protein